MFSHIIIFRINPNLIPVLTVNSGHFDTSTPDVLSSRSLGFVSRKRVKIIWSNIVNISVSQRKSKFWGVKPCSYKDDLWGLTATLSLTCSKFHRNVTTVGYSKKAV